MNVCVINKYLDKAKKLDITLDYIQFDPRKESIAIQKGDEELYIPLDMPEEMQEEAFKFFIERIS